MAIQSQIGRKADHGRGLADAAFLVRAGNDLAHSDAWPEMFHVGQFYRNRRGSRPREGSEIDRRAWVEHTEARVSWRALADNSLLECFTFMAGLPRGHRRQADMFHVLPYGETTSRRGRRCLDVNMAEAMPARTQG